MLFVCATIALLALPAQAGAKPGYEVRPGSFELTASLPGHDGFSYSISAHSHNRVELLALKDGALVAYKVKGRASSRRVHADFGPLGRIDFKIELERSRSSPSRSGRCKGRPPIRLGGGFHGSVRFEGEPGVQGVVSRRGRVIVRREFKAVCEDRHHERRRRHRPRKRREQRKIDLAFLSAKSRTEGRKVEFDVLNLNLLTKPPFSFAVIVATLSERVGQVSISRRAIELEEEVLELSKPGATPETAIATPPKPFRGSATYSSTPGSAPTWTGDLQVRLPGAGLVPLTGPGFRAKLCRGFSAGVFKRCLYGSGSHSQPLALARLSSLR